MTALIGMTRGPGPSEVDAAVRSVLAELLGHGHEISGAGAIFAGRLLSLRHAEEFAVGSGVIRVAPGTVITPLARDHLKKFKVEIRLVSRSEAERERPSGEWAFAIESRSAKGLLEALRRGFLEGEEAWRELDASLGAVANWVVGREERGAFLLADEAASAVYRACQVPGVRAATAWETEGVFRAKRSMGVNFLVVEPAGKPINLIRQLAATFRRGGAPLAPGRLG